MERREEIDRDAKEGRSSSCVHFLRFRDAFDFYPSGRGERSRNDRAQRRWHARSVSDGSFPSFRLISIAAKRGKRKNYRVERGQPRSNERNEIETASLDSRPVSHEKLERQSTHPPWLWVEAGNLSHRSRLYILRHFNVILFWHETIIPTIRTAIRIAVRKWRPW